jgi:hypothetical protein
MTPADLMELGLKLFPVTPQKKPALKGWQAYAVSATIEHIRQDWRNGFRAFGIYLLPSRLVALDSDTPAARGWSDQNLPETPMTTLTKRGDHRFYRLPDTMAAPKDIRPIAGVALDRKAKGYVIAPGSLIGGFVYKETAFWDTPLHELPLYPAGIFPPERLVVPCKITIGDMPLNGDAVAIAKWFIDNSEDSVEGENGSRVLKRAASFFVNGMALDHASAWFCMAEWNLHKAKPRWGEKEMLHAMETSRVEGAANGRPRGWAYTDWAKQ